jgi:hypothetical protein
MPHVVIEEIWSISSDADKRKLLRSSLEPLFCGERQAAFDYAKQRVSEFECRGFQEDADYPYWWGRNNGDRANHRFVIRPAPL